MRLVHSLLLAGAAIAGLAILAPSIAGETHRLSIPLPGGGVETIEYSGPVAPRVAFHPVMLRPVADPWADGLWSAGFAMPSFAAFDRIAAEMDAHMDAMMRQTEIMARNSQPLGSAVLKDMPPGTTSFSIVSQSSGNGVCTQVTRVTRGAGDAKPQVVSETSGDCGAVQAGASGLTPINYQGPAAGPRHPPL